MSIIIMPLFLRFYNSLNVFETIDDYYDSDKTDKHTLLLWAGAESDGADSGGQGGGSGHGTGALAFASGMAAATTAVLTVRNKRAMWSVFGTRMDH